MSQKINILFILAKHFRSAIRNSATDKISWPDIFMFLVVPAVTAAVVYRTEITDKANTISLLTSVCAIFAGLLLNLLVLVYDQNKRATEKLLTLSKAKRGLIKPASNLAELNSGSLESVEDAPIRRYSLHKKLLSELVVNISYAVIIAVFSSVSCLIAYLTSSPPKNVSAIEGFWPTIENYDFKNLLFSTSVFLTTNLVLTLLMIVKRVFKLMEDD
ncbi:hypothetical protein [Pseudomonas batumici]|uniref:hypothetical protein n=1 Tax=Pseudomonas batumici TaxID=226910 RepID=UPI0012EEA1FF|nr:hypothetical protein [Pseudomonas batumici]